MENNKLEEIKEIVKDFFDKLTIPATDVRVSYYEVINIDITLEEPQILIGLKGQTLSEIQRILRMIISKKFQQNFFINLDINGYKRKKVEYLERLAKEIANEVVLGKKEKHLEYCIQNCQK
jgi:spoIIIJ-associated protein